MPIKLCQGECEGHCKIIYNKHSWKYEFEGLQFFMKTKHHQKLNFDENCIKLKYFDHFCTKLEISI